MATKDREAKLQKLFRDITCGNRKVKGITDAKLFFESVAIHRSSASCIEVIVMSNAGLEAIRTATRSDLSPSFLTGQVLPFLVYLSDESIKVLANGDFLHKILKTIVEPPTVWNALLDLLNRGALRQESLKALGWLTVELLQAKDGFGIDICKDGDFVLAKGGLLHSEHHQIRELGYQIEKMLGTRNLAPTLTEDLMNSAGGRHDNDFADFRKISIYPTADEVLSTTKPFYRTADEVFGSYPSLRAAIHLDNQFRLLREDMLAELRDDLLAVGGQKKGKRSASKFSGLIPIGIDHGDDKRSKKCSISLACTVGLEALQKIKPNDRTKYLRENRNILKHQSFGAMCNGKDVVAFAFVDRNEDLLVKSPPVLSLIFTDAQALKRALLSLKLNTESCFVIVDTPIFSYEPVLKGLKSLNELPFPEAILNPSAADLTYQPPAAIQAFATKLESLTPTESGMVHIESSDVYLEESQRESILNALVKTVSIIQGPPGTGKSFVGSQIVKYIHALSDLRILVISYTNHALDQFLEDLLDVGIREDHIVRLGSKSTTRTLRMLLSRQKATRTRDRSFWNSIDQLNEQRKELAKELDDRVLGYTKHSFSYEDIMEFLEFSENHLHFYSAFQVPESDYDFVTIGRKGKEIEQDYLFDRWKQGLDPGNVKPLVTRAEHDIWSMVSQDRTALLRSWEEIILRERVDTIAGFADSVDSLTEKKEKMLDENKVRALISKRIIACTTTAAAKYNEMIRDAKPDIVVVEEAGEILECHILTALGPTVKQLILIGDHKQLAPKINNYALSIAKGDGFDLNRSLFERLIMHGVPHTTLRKQHRMHPNISAYPRAMTYPDLLDDPKTLHRRVVAGLQTRVVFVHHQEREGELKSVQDRRDPMVKSSKFNNFEANMTLKCVRYLCQQGYSTEDMVVLTPYLGQLRLMHRILSEENDPILNDMDNYELIRAGIITQAAGQVKNRPLRISTIDNYQGEESDIVIGSLTRSNGFGDIGFMAEPERLNVLLSRARCGIILFGNMNTFVSNKRGKDTWSHFFKLLKERGSLYDGLPVKCERHPDRTAIIEKPEHFEQNCPDGGCAEECGMPLACGAHKCPLRCHRLVDHSKAKCRAIIKTTCLRNHVSQIPCSQQGNGCAKCAREDKDTERRLKRDLALEQARLQKQNEYTAELQQIQDELDHYRRKIKYLKDEEADKNNLEDQRAQAEALKRVARTMQKDKIKSDLEVANANEKITNASPSSRPDLPSNARDEWMDFKSEGAHNDALDSLIDMIGLEEVKQCFLDIKSRVDLAIRQDISLDSERLSCSLLGNPGTGKTTVARLYAKFLCSVGALPGACLKETTGSALSNSGVTGCQAMLDDILNEGGGVFFIDEAYQMTSGNNMGGKAVLDYLLPEVENLTGKVVFVLAGYSKEMESFFAHNPGLPDRFPITMNFADYTDQELLRIFQLKIDKKYRARMKCEKGSDGLYCRIVATRIGRGRGEQGFGNARTVENVLAAVARRQAARIGKERRAKKQPDELLFTKGDLIGSEPSDALLKSKAWAELQQLIGLDTVKQSVKVLVDTIAQNYVRELAEQPVIEYSLNKVFLGSPGTGKTTVAKLYGKILVDLGLLSRSEVVVKNPSDFVGAHLGQSEQQTKGILSATIGKVLVIDEAYGLYDKSSVNDPYKTAVIDTIVAEVQSIPGDDRCVLLLGYKDQMETLMNNVNPGLSRRFPISAAFCFEDFNSSELHQILDLKLKKQHFQATDQGKNVAMEMLSRARNRPHFGNAGEIDIILDGAKSRHQQRMSFTEVKYANMLEAVDFDPDFERAERSETNIDKLFAGTVGNEDIIIQLKEYQETVRTMKVLNMDPKENIPFNFLFRGPPGTGKTTTAKKMGKVFYDMGFLTKAEVIECSASDIVGQYVGQTGPKVQQMMEKALGKVLFIDEAYRLAEGSFAKEAIDEIVDCVTKSQYMKRLVVILAGYEADINHLMSVNPGLTSRFGEVIDFRALTSSECVGLMLHYFNCQKEVLEKKNPNISTDLECLQNPDKSFAETFLQLFSDLSRQEGWASARDVLTIAKRIFNKTLKTVAKIKREEICSITLDPQLMQAELESLIQERAIRVASLQKLPLRDSKQPMAQLPNMVPNRVSLNANVVANVLAEKDNIPSPLTEHSEPVQSPPTLGSDNEHVDSLPVYKDAVRDDGVSDEVWRQLQKDKEAATRRENDYQALKNQKDKATGEARKRILDRLLEEEHLRRQEALEKERLVKMGCCPMGFEWIKQASGYRCAGGSHFVDEPQLKHMGV